MVNTVSSAKRLHQTGQADSLALLEQAPDGVIVIDADDRCTFVNESACRMLGAAREALLDTRVTDLIPAQDVDRFRACKAQLVGGASRIDEWQLRRMDGTWLAVEAHAKALSDGQWQAILRDVSERKARESQREAELCRLETEQTWLRAVLDTVPLGVVLYRVGGEAFYNRRSEELMGMQLSPTGGSAQYAKRVLFPDGSPVPREQLVSTRVLRDQQTVIGEEYIIEQPDGSRIHVLGSAAPIRDRNGRLAGTVDVFQDISERMRMEEAVHEERRLLQSIFDILPVGVWIADESGRIVRNNPAGERIWRGARYVPVAEFGQYKGWWLDSGKRIAAEEGSSPVALQSRREGSSSARCCPRLGTAAKGLWTQS